MINFLRDWLYTVSTTQKEYIVFGGNFALDKDGNPITRTEEEMENIEDDD